MNNALRLLVGLGLVVLLEAGTAWEAFAESRRGAGTVTAGPVTVRRLATAPQVLKAGDAVYWGDTVESHKEGIARLRLGGRTTVTVRELSCLELRREAVADGMHYVVSLVRGRVRVSVARMLMQPGEQVEVRTRNAVASVRGTDFIVETVERPGRPQPFGLLGAREVAHGVGENVHRGETVVVTLSGLVQVANRLTGLGRGQRIGAYEAERVSGPKDPVRFRISSDDLKAYFEGLTPPRQLSAARGEE